MISKVMLVAVQAALLLVIFPPQQLNAQNLKNNDQFNEDNMIWSDSDVKRVEYEKQILLSKGQLQSIDGQFIGQIGGLQAVSSDQLMVFHRGSRRWTWNTFLPGDRFNTLLYGPIRENVLSVVNPKKLEIIESWGANKFYMPHGLTIDHENNVWLTDVGTHQVYKFNFLKNGEEPVLTLGQQFQNGNDQKHFCKPTKVAVSKQTGDVFVADGYCNQRVARFTSQGKFIREYTDSQRPIQVAHSIALIESQNLVCTVSRQDGRIICFDIESGRKMHELTDQSMKTVFAIEYDPSSEVIHAVTGQNLNKPAIGLTFDATKKSFGKLIQTWDADKTDLADAHDLTQTPDRNKIFVGQLNGEINQFSYSKMSAEQAHLKSPAYY